ncbi:hypothetical protein HCN44_000881 [Aphidius gifuensis]|uniref:Large ribosomal subunit protein uL6 n=1 Tax=Aphidius gifuensis TaxID=684658 RepID=A0A835CNN8_APHGI|nr:hypothetical protein HCN44_000881 [Aphidius gifuensis]
MPILIPEAPVVNPNAALGTPPRLNSDGEAIHDLEMGQSSTDDCQYYLDDNNHNNKSDEYEMDIELNPSDFLDMITDMESSNQIDQISSHDVFKHTSEQHEVYVCSLCDKAFSSKGHLSLHAKIHVGAENDVVGEKVITDDHTSYKRPYQCDLCNKSYSTAKHRWGHVSTTHRGHPAVTCRFCSRIYSTRINLEEHIKSRHTGLSAPPEPPGPYIQQDTRFQCKKCPKMYTNITDLNKHSRVCIVGGGVGNERTKNKNKNNHNNKLPIKGKCLMDASDDMSSNESDDYSREYRNAEAKLSKNPQLTILKQALTRNNNNNNNEGINKRLKIKDKKKLIIKKEMIDGGGYSKEYEKIQEKPYICTLCKKDFVVKSSLSRHILSSHGIDPSPFIENDKCLKKLLLMPTATNNNIKSEPLEINSINQEDENDENDDEEEQQQQQHDDETINDNHIEIETVFVCEICTRDFNDRASLWLHIRATHKEYAAFACGICLKICSDNEQLLNHVNMYHGGSKLLVSEQRRYSCTICGRQHDSRKKLITHVSIHNIDSSYDPANFVQLNSNYYSDNIPIINDGQEQWTDFDAEDGEKVNCHVCFKSFPNEDHLIRHQRNAHKTDQLINDTTATLSTTPSSSSTTTTTNGTKGPYNLFYVCELCGSSHPSKWERWLHVSNTHYDDATIKCERTDCAKIFSTKSLKNDHVQHHAMQGPSPNTCEICGKLWGSRVDYWKHVMGVHADTVPLICGVCLKVFPDVYQLSLHVKNHWPLTNGDFSCDICGRPYSNKSKMSRHRKIHGIVDNDLMMMTTTMTTTTTNGMSLLNQINNDDDNNIMMNDNIQDYNLTCEICTDKSFINWDDLCNHRRLTHGLFPCDLCNKCYGRASHLWKHVNRVHKGHSDVTCRYCLKTSASKDHLAAHIAKTHRYEPDEKQQLINNYINSKTSGGSSGGVGVGGDDDVIHHCEKCNKGFHKRYLLRRHMKGCQNYRKDPGALLTRCRACERIFKDRASLQKHIENHHSSYTCHLCNETITSKLGIMTHNRINHMNHDDLTCTSCKKLFRTKEDLDVHKKDHKYHNSLNVCDFCDTVESKLKLKMHILSLHRNEIGVSCGVCLIPMKDPKDLKKHVEDEHPGILSRPNTCQVCGKQYASKWKAFDHTKKCHGKVFRTCKQCLAVFTSDDDIRYHYEYIHNVTKEQLANIESSYDNSSKIDDQSIDIDYLDYDDDDDNNSLLYNNSFSTTKRKRSESHECDICYELFANDDEFGQHYRDVHNKDPDKMFKKIKSKKKSKNRDNYECKSCTKQFSTRSLYWNHIKICTNKYLKDDLESGNSMSILESHLKNNNQLKIQQQQQQQYDNNNDDFTDAAAGGAAAVVDDDDNNDVMNDMSLNIPDFNLFEDINMQLSGQKPLPPLMPLTTVKNPQPTKCYRKDSRKVYDESTNTVCACEVCGKQWPAKKHLWQHLIRFHRAEAAVTCGVCLKLCKTYFDLSCHLKEAHEAILSCEGNNFTCKTCGRYHNARSKLLLHMSIHINNNEHIWCMKCAVSFENQDKLNEHANNCIVKRREEADVGDQIIEKNNIKHENEEQEEEQQQQQQNKKAEEHEEQQEQVEEEEEEGEYDDKGSLIGDGASLMEEVGEEADFESEHEAFEDNGENNTEQSEHSQHSEDSDSSSSSSSSNSSVAASASEDEEEEEEAEANAKDTTKCSDVIIKEHESHDDKSNISIDIKPVINNDSSTSQENKNDDEKLLNTVDVNEPINIKCEKNSNNEEKPLISSESSPKPDDNDNNNYDKIKQDKDEEENENEEEDEEEEEMAIDSEHDESVEQDEQNEEENEGEDDDDQVEEEEEEEEQEDEAEEEEDIYPEVNHEGLEGIKDIDYEQSSPDKSHDEIESDNENNEEEEGVFVTEHEDEMQIENLDGTVLMIFIMKQIVCEQTVKVPEGLTVTVKSRLVTVKGPRGVLKRSFKHLALDIKMVGPRTLKVQKWFGTKKELAAVRTVCSHIENMLKGVTKGFLYKMRAVYAHFPINCVATENNTVIEIRNFLGEKYIRRVKMSPGVTVSNSTQQKEELIIQGNSLEDVSRSAALIQQSTTVKNKDIRKFLDGLYVSQKTTVVQDDD